MLIDMILVIIALIAIGGVANTIGHVITKKY